MTPTQHADFRQAGKEQQYIVNEVYMIRNIEKSQLCSTSPYQKIQASGFPEKYKGSTHKKKLLLLTPAHYSTTCVYPKGLTKNVIRILKRLQNDKIIHSYIRKESKF